MIICICVSIAECGVIADCRWIGRACKELHYPIAELLCLPSCNTAYNFVNKVIKTDYHRPTDKNRTS